MLLKPKPQATRTLSKDYYLVVAVVVLYVLQLLVNAPYLWAFAGLGVAYVLGYQMKLSQFQRRWLLVGIAVLTAPLLLHLWAQPSQAVMLTRIQNFFVGSFVATGTDNGGRYSELANMLINTVRGIYIFFLLVAAWQAWEDRQRGEEMSGFARNMLGSLLGVFSVDLVSTFIVPVTTV